MSAFRGRNTYSDPTLEVNTVTPPSLIINAPTPRAFTYPVSHNLSDSLSLAASSSLFGPNLQVSFHNDECRSPPPLSAFTRILSPISTHASTSRPKRGDKDYVKRPDNAFILFRRKWCKDRASVSPPSLMASGPPSPDPPSLAASAPGEKQRQADLSKTIAQQWKALSPEDRLYWGNLAKEKKREHETLHPNYVFRPRRFGSKNRSSASASGLSTNSSTDQRRKKSATAVQSLEFVVPAHPRGAAPTPPPYQAIQMPNVYLSTSGSGSFAMDADADASLMLTGGGAGDQNGISNYIPNLSGAYNFEASLQSDFLRLIFASPISPTSSSSSMYGSGLSSPYMPAGSSFDPSAFSPSYASPILHAAYPTVGHMGLESTGVDADEHYTSYFSAWAASSPWASTPTAGFAEGDFDIERIQEIGWNFDTAFFPVTGGKYPAPYDQEFGLGSAGERTLWEDGKQLHIPSGNLGMEIGFDYMRAWRSF